MATVMLYLSWAVSPVSAHADLVRSNPAANAILDQSPAQVELLFSEPLENEISTIVIYDTSGATVDNGDAQVDAANFFRMTISLPPLTQGIYLVSWIVISRIDGHQSAGSFPFAVGQVDIAALPEVEQSSNVNMPVSALIARWLLLASAAILAGQYPSRFFIWNFTTGSNTTFDRHNQAWDTLYELGLFGVVLAFVLGVLSQAGLATGHELALPWADETRQVLTGTRLGVLWLARLLLALLGFLLIRIRSIQWRGVGQFIIGLVLLLAISLTSHSATEFHPLLPVLSDWLHLVGMSFWFGGLAHLIIGLAILKNGESKSRTQFAASAARRFSIMAVPGVAVLGVTGIYSAFQRVGSFTALFETAYGHSLLFKQGFVAVLLLIAAVNLLIISPGLRQAALQDIPNSKYFQFFGRTVLTEIILAALLLVNVSLMTYLSPAVTPFPQTTLYGKSSVDDLNIVLFVSPGLPGQNTFEVRLSPRRSVQFVKSVRMTFVPVTANVPPSELDLIETSQGVYTAQGGFIAFPGRWLVEVPAKRPDKFDTGVRFDFIVTGAGDSDQNETSTVPNMSKIVVLLDLLLVGINTYLWDRNRTQADA